VTVAFEKRAEPAVEVDHRIKPDALLPLLLAAAEDGVRGALQTGEFGYPVMGVKATVSDGEMDPQLSNEMAFRVAGNDAVRKAMKDNLVLLEPVMKLEVTVPEEFLGAVTADLMGRQADIQEVLVRGKLRVVVAEVPLRLMFDYADKVRSLSQGRAGSS